MSKTRNVSERQARALLAEGCWSTDDELSDGVFLVHVDDKNRALQILRSNGGGQLYEDRNELVGLLKRIRERPTRPDRHLLVDRLAYEGEFISHALEIAESLPTALGLEALPPRTLDGLATVEAAVRRAGYARCQK